MELFKMRYILFITLMVTVGQILAADNVTTGSTPTTSTSSSSIPDQKSSQAPGQVTSDAPVTATTPEETTLSPEQLCSIKSNTSCSECLGVPGAKCLWCNSDSSCQIYPYKKVLPTGVCSLSKARWGVCWLNFEAMLISVSVIGGIIILTITCCCVYCCCCRGNNRKKIDRDTERLNTQKMDRKAKSDERRSERKERLDEIRRKYGLMKEEPYQRFDA